jgi:alpha-L-fucosidase
MEYITIIPNTEPNKAQIEQIQRRFGMFIHFGINTFNNVEWSDGTIPASAYNPCAIDAEQWVRTAYEAGMNYVILITKHHDGFCLWDSKYTDYSVASSGNKTDVVKAVADACEKYKIKLGLYYSLWDCHEHSFKNDFDRGYINYMYNQLTELLDGRYGEVVELWFDGAWEKTCMQWQMNKVYDLIKRLQPKCQVGINHTIGEYNMAGFPSERYQPQNYQYRDPIRNFPADFRLWDPYICREDDPKIYTFNGEEYYLPFEATICSREGFSWFYSDTYESKPLMAAETIIKNYKQLSVQDNLLVINMPPNRQGRLVQSDINNLYIVANKLGIARNNKLLNHLDEV